MKLAILLLLWIPLPANAHCYSIWHYPRPQHCGSKIMVKRANNDKIWYVEITKLPDSWEREIAIDKLKEQLK